MRRNGLHRVNRWLGGLCIALLLGLTFLLGCFTHQDMDLWWHLKAGKQILAGRGIPDRDTFTFGASGREWIDLHWGFQVVAAWIYQWGGLPGLIVCTAASAVAATALALAATQVWQRPVAVVLCWLPALGLMSGRFYVRPEIVTLICLGALLATLHHAKDYPRLAWFLAPIQILWVNCQGLFVLGLVLLGCWWTEVLMHGDRRDMRRWCMPTVLAFAASFLNPFTWRGALFPFTLFRRLSSEHDFYVQQAAELISLPQFLARYGASSPYIWLSLALMAAGGISFLGPVRLRTFRLLAFLAFSWLGLLATRNQPQFAMVAGAVLAWNVSDWLRHRATPSLTRQVLLRATMASLLVGLIVWVGTGSFYRLTGEGRLVGWTEHPHWHAHAAARIAAAEGMPRHVIAMHLGQASVFEFHMRPDQRVYVDPRLEVMPRSAMEHYLRLQSALGRGSPDWKAGLNAFSQLPSFLVDHRTHYAVEATLLADPDWRCVWFDDIAGVYVPGSLREEGIPQLVDFTRHFTARSVESHIRGDGNAAYLKQGALLRIAHEMMARKNASLARMLLLSVMRGTDHARSNLIVAAASSHLYRSPLVNRSPAEWEPLDLLATARVRHYLSPVAARGKADFESWYYLATAAFDLQDRADLPGLLSGMRHSARTLAQRRLVQQFGKREMHTAESHKSRTVADDPLAAAQALVEERSFARALQVLSAARAEGDKRAFTQPWVDGHAKLLLIAGQPAAARAVWSEAEKRSPGIFGAAIGTTYLVERRYEDALTWCRRAQGNRAQSAQALSTAALCHLELGNAEEAADACEKALAAKDLSPSDAERCQWILDLVAAYGAPQ